jgi:SPX domain protein involved in polyphosphate accumulation
MNSKYRYEIKFVLNDIQLSEISAWINAETSMTKRYAPRVINNLYFDDIEFSSVKDNLSGIANRKKYRLRWYGEAVEGFNPVFEIKGRNDRVGSKTVFDIEDLNGIMHTHTPSEILQICTQALQKKKYVLDNFLFPSLQVQYLRSYFEDHQGIRLTIDQDINFSLPLLHGPLNEHISRPYPMKIVEIKFHPSEKDKVSELIGSLHLRPKRHSKYLAGLASLGLAQYI